MKENSQKQESIKNVINQADQKDRDQEIAQVADIAVEMKKLMKKMMIVVKSIKEESQKKSNCIINLVHSDLIVHPKAMKMTCQMTHRKWIN